MVHSSNVAGDEMAGGCQCGHVRYTARIRSDDASLCHCRMCQRSTGNVSVAFCNVAKADVTWESEPTYFTSSPFARRGFCALCGTSLSFDYPDSEQMDLTVASFDDPSPFVPRHHFGIESRLEHWRDTADLPGYRADGYAPLNERWMKALGKLPD